MPVDIIPPSEIQAELSRIWGELERTNKNRASLFNLIFFTKKRPRAEYIQTIAKAVIEKFPSRVIFITQEATSSQDFLNTRVSVVSPNASESDIACDSIQIDVAGKEIQKVPFVILPHILPDLPVYVIWMEDPNDTSSLFIQLQKLATRLIFDSEAVDNLNAFASTLLSLEKKWQCDIADLNWARIENWRDLLASTFYTKERLEKLKAATQIQILYNAQETSFTCHTQFQALYLQGWLSSQLDWKFKDQKINGQKTTISYSREGGSVTITLYPEPHKTLKAGTILSVDIETEDQAHFSFGRNLESPHFVSMRFSTLEKCDIPLRYIFSKDESGQSLIREISHKGTSQHYLSLLETMQARCGA